MFSIIHYLSTACTVASLDTSEIICSSRARAGAPKSLPVDRSKQWPFRRLARRVVHTATTTWHDSSDDAATVRASACNMAAEKQQSLTHERETTIVASIRSMHACNRPDGGRRSQDGDFRAVASGQMRARSQLATERGKEKRAAGPRGEG
jgi:hypothetical protein